MLLPSILLVAVLGGPTELVLRDGGTIPIRELVIVENNRVLYRDPHGTLYSIPLEEVDLESTTDPDRDLATDELPALPVTQNQHGLRRLSVSTEEKDRLLDDLERNARQVTPAEQTVDPTSAPEPPASTEPAEQEVDDEASWRATARELRARIDQFRSALEQARHRERELNDFILFVAGGSGNADGFSQYMEELADIREDIPRLEAALDRAERAWSDFTELARRKGILPGWLR